VSGMRRAEEVSVGGVEPLGVLDVGRCDERPPPAGHTTSAPLICPPYYPPPAYYPRTDRPTARNILMGMAIFFSTLIANLVFYSSLLP
jgi:hypothetical protein